MIGNQRYSVFVCRLLIILFEEDAEIHTSDKIGLYSWLDPWQANLECELELIGMSLCFLHYSRACVRAVLFMNLG